MTDRERELRMALEAARQFLDPQVPRGPDVNGWRNTVNLVNAALKMQREDQPR